MNKQKTTEQSNVQTSSPQTCLKWGFSVSLFRASLGLAIVFCMQTVVSTDAVAADHYLLYDVKMTKGAKRFKKLRLNLEDVHETGIYEVRKVKRLGNPADKNGGGISDPEAHYVSYEIKSPKHEPRHSVVTGILVENQFGEIYLDTMKADRLLISSAKDLDHPVNPLAVEGEHFKCYRVRVTKRTPRFPKGIQVSIEDQFGEINLFDVKKPERLCIPVDIEGGGILDPDAEMLCYQVKRARHEPKHKKVNGIHLNNMFGAQQVDTRSDKALCVPSTRPACLDGKCIFATSVAYTGNLGGIAGADQKCKEHAAAGGLPGTYIAWLSDSTVAARDRTTHSSLPYVRTDGEVIADDFDDLVDGAVKAPIDRDEFGDFVHDNVWTGTLDSGEQSGANPLNFMCNDWQQEVPGIGTIGCTAEPNFWSKCSGAGCFHDLRLFCIGQ